MFPPEHTQLALEALGRKSDQDPRVRTHDLTWLGTWIHEYHQQREAGLGHDAALAVVLRAIDLTLGGVSPVPLTIPAPPLASQPTTVLGGTEGAPTEKVEVVQNGRVIQVDRRWTWKSVYHPRALEWFQADSPLFIALTQWIASVGGNALTIPPKTDPDLVKTLTEVCGLSRLRVWVDPQDPLGPLSTVEAFYLAVETLVLYGGGTLALLKDEGDTRPYPQAFAEWWMKGLSMESAEVRDWQTVQPSTLVEYKAGRDGARGLAKVNGGTGVVVNVDPALDWVIQPVKGWRVVEVAGPGHGWVRLSQ